MTLMEHRRACEDLDKVIEAINTLIGLGIYPLELEMDINTLVDLACCSSAGDDLFESDENGVFDLWKNASKYNFSIMGIPIRPKRQYGIQIREKEVEE